MKNMFLTVFFVSMSMSIASVANAGVDLVCKDQDINTHILEARNVMENSIESIRVIECLTENTVCPQDQYQSFDFKNATVYRDDSGGKHSFRAETRLAQETCKVSIRSLPKNLVVGEKYHPGYGLRCTIGEGKNEVVTFEAGGFEQDCTAVSSAP